MAAVKSLLDKTRLLTLTGSGGAGKTRLSLQVASDVLEQYRDGVWLVELAPLSDPSLVPQKVAEVLGLRETSDEPITTAVIDALQNKQALLVLDNCEHVLHASARVAEAILSACPRVQILASSREALGIAGERTYRVPSLSLPLPAETYTPESLSAYEGVRLFLERAAAVKSDFVVTAQNAPVLASVCRRLDGIPLAIELAAGRVRSMSVEELGRRLDDRFRLLTGGSRTAMPRQQTLRALIDWSYDLLEDNQKALLMRLSVFAGGWTLEAAEAVCDGFDVLDLLTSLVDKSLLIAEEREGATRYRMLETVRQYAREKLEDGGPSEAVRRRHRQYFLALAETAESRMMGAEQALWFQRLESEHDNLRAALEGGDRESRLRMAGALWRFWWVRGYYSEGRSRLHEILREAPVRSLARAKSLHGAGVLALSQGDAASSRTLLTESLAIRREFGDNPGIALSLNALGIVAANQGDYASARTLQEESLAIRRAMGDKKGIAASLNNLGILAEEQGDPRAARTLHEEALMLYRELGDRRGAAGSLNNLGNVAASQGDYGSARTLYEENLAILRALGDRQGLGDALNNLGLVRIEQGDLEAAWSLLEESLEIRSALGERRGIANSLEALATFAFVRKQTACAVRLWAAAYRLREEIKTPLPRSEQEAHDGQLAVARQTLGEEGFSAAWTEGSAMSLEQAMEAALMVQEPL